MAGLKATWAEPPGSFHNDVVVGVLKISDQVIWQTERNWTNNIEGRQYAKRAAEDHLAELILFVGELMSATR
jgi:hypothetical protein